MKSGHVLPFFRTWIFVVCGVAFSAFAANTVTNIPAGGSMTLASGETTTVDELYVGTTANDATPAVLTIESGAKLNVRQLHVGKAAGSVGQVVQRGDVTMGRLLGDYQNAFNIGYAADATGSWTLESGTLDLRTGGAAFIVGKSGMGSFTMTGGTVYCNSYFILARLASSTGTLTMTGGTIYNSSDAGEIFCDDVTDTTATMTMGGTALFVSKGMFRLGTGTLTIGSGAEVRCPYLAQRELNAKAGKTARLVLDGGKITSYGNSSTFFLGGYVAGYGTNFTEIVVGNGGVTLEVPQGRDASVAQSLAAQAGATAGDLVKTGAGTLRLLEPCTHAGSTRVEQGVLVLNAPDTVDTTKLTVSSGACVGVVRANWSEAEIATLRSRLAAGTAVAVVETEDVVTATALDYGTQGFAKIGSYVQTLSGANTWMGETQLRDGVLKAEVGQGIPSTSHIRFYGGNWAPASPFTVPFGTEAGAWDTGEDETAGFTALGAALTVNAGGDRRTLTAGTSLGALRLNDIHADAPLTFENPLALANTAFAISVEATNSAAVARLAGAIAQDDAGSTATQILGKRGVGTLEITGAVSGSKTALAVAGGTLRLTNTTVTVGETSVSNSACLVVATNTSFTAGPLTLGEKYMSRGCVDIDGGAVQSAQVKVGNQGHGTLNVRGGSLVGGNTDFCIGQAGQYLSINCGTGTCTVTGGRLVSGGNFQVGCYGTGALEVEGGEVSWSNWGCLGRYATGIGTAMIRGGRVFSSNASSGLILGEEGQGALTVAGTGTLDLAGRLRFGVGSSAASGSIALCEQGTIRCAFVQRQSANEKMSFVVDGGTLRAAVDSAAADTATTSTSFFQKPYSGAAGGIESVRFGPHGVTFDTDGHTVGLNDAVFVREANGGLVKTGTGTLTIDTPNNFGTLDVQAGTLRLARADLAPRKVDIVTNLVHRWNFNGSLADSVGGQTATAVGAVTAGTNGYTVVGGGASGKNYIDLGANVFPTDGGAVTFEFWVTRNASRSWQRLFNFGQNSTERIFFALERSGGIAGGLSPQAVVDGVTKAAGTSYAQANGQFTFTIGTQYHMAVVFKPVSDTVWNIALYQYDAATGALVRKFAYDANAGFTLKNMNLANCWLGRSASTGDPDAEATFDEVRIWKCALDETEIAAHAAGGPDAIFTGAGAAPTLTTVAPGATLDLGGTTFAQSNVALAGTVTNGTLSVDGMLEVGAGTVATANLAATLVAQGTLAVEVGDRITLGAPLDLSKLSLLVTDLQDLTQGSWTLIESPRGEITGRFASHNLSGTGRGISISPTCVRVGVNGMLVVIR